MCISKQYVAFSPGATMPRLHGRAPAPLSLVQWCSLGTWVRTPYQVDCAKNCTGPCSCQRQILERWYVPVDLGKHPRKSFFWSVDC